MTCERQDCGRDHPPRCTDDRCKDQRRNDCNAWHVAGSYDRHCNILKVQAAERRKARLEEENKSKAKSKAKSGGKAGGKGKGKAGKTSGNGQTTRNVTDHPGRSTQESANGKRGKKKTSTLGLQTLQTLQSLQTTSHSTPSQTYPPMTTPTTTSPSSTPSWTMPPPPPTPALSPSDPTVVTLARSTEALVADIRSMQGQVAALAKARR